METQLSSIAQRFANGTGGALALAMIAFSVVFLVLGGLTLIIISVRYMAESIEKTLAAKKQSAPAAKKPQAPAAATPAPAKGAEEGVIAAVIAAAVAASGGGFVTSVRPSVAAPTQRSASWKMAGRMDLQV